MNLNTAPDHIDELIANYLAGEATPDQRAVVEEWRDRNVNNRRYFEQLKLIFEKASAPVLQQQFDTDLAWKKLSQRLPRKEARTVPLDREHFDLKVFLRVAAAVVILVAVGLFTYKFFRQDSLPSKQVLADKKTEADTLPDGSDVFLNRNTKIEYTFNKKENTHIARLVGEAYFNIQHDDDKNFIVEAEGTLIKDIGTSFNVKAYPGSPTIEVVVEEGEVMFYTEGNPGIYLKANGKGVYNKNTKTFTIAEPEPNVTAYKTKFFSFSDHSLSAVVQTLNAVYSTKIQIDDNLKDCRLTVSFNNEDVDEIANIIAETLSLKVSKSGNVITLKGSGCGEATTP